jgi:hypothetical protein
MPVNSGILPSLAFLYRPLGSRASATSSGMSTKTSTKARGSSEPVVTACRSRAVARSALYGEMKDVIAIVELSAKSRATCEKGSLAICAVHRCAERLYATYLCYPPDVLISVLLTEAQVLVQAETHIVAVEAVRGESEMEKVLLECGCDGRFAGCGKTGKPDGEALLFTETVALGARERWVPCDVTAIECQLRYLVMLAG